MSLGEVVYHALFFYTYWGWLYIVLLIAGTGVGVFGGIMNYVLPKLYGTSVLGGITIIRGFSLFFSVYPDGLFYLRLLLNGVKPEYNMWMYAFFIGMVVAAGLSFIY